MPGEPSKLGPALRSGLATAGGLAASTAGVTARGLGLLLRAPDVHRVAAGLLLAAGMAWSSDRVREDLATWPRFQVARAALATTPLPAGLSERARRDLELAALPADGCALDPHLVPQVAARLAKLPWVREVEQVRLHGEAKLGFSLVAREPVARLDEPGQHGALTRDGWVVPVEYAADAAKLPAVAGLPPASDASARRRALDAALGVLDDLAELRPRVRTVDVKNLSGRDKLGSEVTLVLDDGLVVEWGRPPEPESVDPSTGRPKPGRATTDAGLRRRALAGFLEKGPDRATVARVSVRWDEVTYVLKPTAAPTPLAAAPR